jgi:cytochrome c-type biogenesis protein CcmH/NrfG
VTLKHYLVVFFSFGLLILIYLQPIKNPELNKLNRESTLPGEFSFEEYREGRFENLNDSTLAKIADIQANISNTGYPESKALKDSLVKIYAELDELALAAELQATLASKTQTESDWLAAAELYRIVFLRQQNRHAFYFYLQSKFKESLEEALKINPDNLDTKVDLAGLLMEEDANVMAGVEILLDVVEKEPQNIEANLLLGRFGIVSGQYDRAVMRLETVISQDPTNSEAYFFLGEAYNALGKIGKAVEMFEICKTLVDNPEFERELDLYIERILVKK